MGIIISLISLPIQELHERRKKKHAEKIARSYTNSDVAPPTQQSHPQSRRSNPQQSQLGSALQPELPTASQQQQQQQQQQRVEEFNPSFGAARVGYPAPAAGANFKSTLTSVSESKATTVAAGQDRMASDEDYMAFLDKANADPNARYSASTAKPGGKMQLKAIDEGVDIPKELKVATEKEQWVYVSDADEPFVAVSLRLEGSKLPDEEIFAKLINHPDPSNADIEILDPAKWDSKGQYKHVVDATRNACMGSTVMVYRVAMGGTRVEYWVVGVDGSSEAKGGKLVGVKALAVES